MTTETAAAVGKGRLKKDPAKTQQYQKQENITHEREHGWCLCSLTAGWLQPHAVYEGTLRELVKLRGKRQFRMEIWT